MQKTQEERILEQINMLGYVTNFWAIHNYILRLASVINAMRKKGYEFEVIYGHGDQRKNCIYKLTKRPAPKQLNLIKNGK